MGVEESVGRWAGGAALGLEELDHGEWDGGGGCLCVRCGIQFWPGKGAGEYWFEDLTEGLHCDFGQSKRWNGCESLFRSEAVI